MKKIQNPDLLIQLNLYQEWQKKDETEAISNNGIDLNNIQDLFKAICLKTQETVEYHQKFVEVLQMIFLADEGDDGEKLSKEKLDKIWNDIVEATKKITNNLRNQTIDSETQTDSEAKKNLKTLENVLVKNSTHTQTDNNYLETRVQDSLETLNIQSVELINKTVTPPPAPPLPPPTLNSSIPRPPPPPLPFMGNSSSIPPPPPLPQSASTISTPPPAPTLLVNRSDSFAPPPPPLLQGNDVSPPSIINPIYQNLPKASKSVKSVNWQKLSESSISRIKFKIYVWKNFFSFQYFRK